MSSPAMPVPTVIPLPADFPITWDPPELQALPFQQDRQHLPMPMSPLAAWYAMHGFATGASRALASYSVPMAFTVGHFNYYYYMAIAPNVPPEQMPEMEEKAQAALMPAVMSFRERWDAEWLPELRALWDEWCAFDLKAADLPRLLARLDEGLAVYQKIWEIHFKLLVPAMVGFSEFRGLYEQLFPESGDLDAYRLLQGFDNKSLEADRATWGLSRKARANAELAALIRATRAEDLAAVLANASGGPAFLADVQAALAEFGRRSDTVQELADASWVEDPRVFFTTLKSYIDQDESADPARRLQEMARQREEAVAEARKALAGKPPEVLGQFEALLRAAQNCSFLQEDHNYWIDQRGLHEVRQLCMEVGRRLTAAGKLDRADDVFMFSPDELRTLAQSSGGGQATVAERRSGMARAATVTAPPMVGTDYGPPPDNPITRAIARFFGGPPAVSEHGLLRGNAGSAGKVRGTARVILTLMDADRLEPGEILVVPTTSPPWTPLFAVASGIVTDTGGALSHCAIVAREYGIPAVVGVAGGTSAIRDGQEIEVDGDAATVRLL